MTKVNESAQVVYHPTRVGVFLKDPNDPAKTAAVSLRGRDIHVHWNAGFTSEVIEAAAREWYPTADKVVFTKLGR